MNKSNTINKNDVLTDPAQIVRLDLENAGYDMDTIHIPKEYFCWQTAFMILCFPEIAGNIDIRWAENSTYFMKTKKSDLSKGICVRPQLQRRRRI